MRRVRAAVAVRAEDVGRRAEDAAAEVAQTRPGLAAAVQVHLPSRDAAVRRLVAAVVAGRRFRPVAAVVSRASGIAASRFQRTCRRISRAA